MPLNYSLNSMKKIFLILLILMSVFFYACRKTLISEPSPLQSNSEFTILQAKEYLKSASGSLSPARFKLQNVDVDYDTNTNALVYW